jgi:Protein of unknown function (DUF4238)
VPDYVRNHLTSSFYLEGFADHTCRVRVVTVGPRARPVRLAKPANLGYRRYFWGRDAALRREVEQKLSEVESDAALTLRALPGSWPPPDLISERASMMQFLAIHLLRTPGWKHLLRQLGERWIAENGDDYPGEMSREEMLVTARSDHFVASTLMGEIPVLASLFGSMHWSLVSFADPCLITSDQPVVAVPFEPGGSEEVLPMPSAGLLHTLEFRIAIDPHHLLLLTWIDRDDLAARIPGTRAIASEANASVRAQADTQWFRHPAADPPFGTVLLGGSAAPTAIAPTLLSPYTLMQARRSRRRREAERHVHDMIEGGVTDELRSIVVRRRDVPVPADVGSG